MIGGDTEWKGSVGEGGEDAKERRRSREQGEKGGREDGEVTQEGDEKHRREGDGRREKVKDMKRSRNIEKKKVGDEGINGQRC